MCTIKTKNVLSMDVEQQNIQLLQQSLGLYLFFLFFGHYQQGSSEDKVWNRTCFSTRKNTVTISHFMHKKAVTVSILTCISTLFCSTQSSTFAVALSLTEVTRKKYNVLVESARYALFTTPPHTRRISGKHNTMSMRRGASRVDDRFPMLWLLGACPYVYWCCLKIKEFSLPWLTTTVRKVYFLYA